MLKIMPLAACWWRMAILLASSAVLSAQVSPAPNATTEGNWSYFGPFHTSSTPYSWQQVHDDVVGPLAITSLGFRPDQSASIQGGSFDCILVLSEAPLGVNANTIQPTFAANHGAHLVTLPRQTVNFVSSTYLPGQPLPSQVFFSVPVHAPYALTAGARFVWEIRIVSRNNAPGAGLFDGVNGPDPFGTHIGFSYGTGCARDAQSNPMSAELALSVSRPTIGVVMNVYDAQPNSMVAMWIGLNSYVPPIPLDPVGAPGCFIHCDSLMTLLIGPTNGSGYTSTILGSANAPAVSFNIYAQAASLAPAANLMGLITSNGHQNYVTVPTPAPTVGFLEQAGLTTPVPYPQQGMVLRY